MRPRIVGREVAASRSHEAMLFLAGPCPYTDARTLSVSRALRASQLNRNPIAMAVIGGRVVENQWSRIQHGYDDIHVSVVVQVAESGAASGERL